MKIRHQPPAPLLPGLVAYLAEVRKKKDFNVNAYIDKKAKVLNDYMDKGGLRASVVAVSGGIDSAVVLALVAHAASLPASPIKKILPLMLPVSETAGATNQAVAAAQGEELCAALGLEGKTFDLGKVFSLLSQSEEDTLGLEGTAWARGQLVSYLRTPTLYYATSLLAETGLPAIVCGTTNLDEGGFLGYFGKASDGMVDIQLISDIHKREVYLVAKALGVPESIMNAVPTGDMFDATSDEEVFGASYDFVELYLNWLMETPAQRSEILVSLDQEAYNQFKEYAGNIEELHAYNGHKYIGASPAIHLDIFDVGIPGGWNNKSPV